MMPVCALVQLRPASNVSQMKYQSVVSQWSGRRGSTTIVESSSICRLASRRRMWPSVFGSRSLSVSRSTGVQHASFAPRR